MLEKLQMRLPLAPEWERVQEFSDSVEIGGLKICRVGLTAWGPNDMEVNASAAEIGAAPLERAYYELIERTAIVEAIRRDLFTFPVDPEGRFAYAKSNGVAGGVSFDDAKRRALLELYERDAILRSWYGGESPVRVNQHVLPNLALNGLYDEQGYLIPCRAPGILVAITLFIPRISQAPFVYGFGAAEEGTRALASSRREAVQRLSFLWGESIEDHPCFSPSPAFHQEVFCHRSGMERILRWVAGKNRNRVDLARNSENEAEISYVDLTPAHLVGKCAVVRAESTATMPLIFGNGYETFARRWDPDLALHPIA